MSVAGQELPVEIINALRYVTRRVHKVEYEMRGLVRQSGAAFQSIESGDGSVVIYDDDGNIVTTLDDSGLTQYTTVLGPPQPESPDVAAGTHSLIISYDGTFVDGDWEDNLVDHVEIHATANAGDTLDDTTQIGTFTSSNGGVFTYPWDVAAGGRWIHLVAVTTAGEEGIASTAVFGVPNAVAPPDGVAPATAPVVTVRSGIRSVVASWPAVPNNDAVLYKVYVDSGVAPAIDSAHLFLTTPQTSVVINRLADGSAFDSTATIHVKVIASDPDGNGPTSADATGTPITVSTVDIGASQVTSTVIADNSITTPKLVALAITAAKIAANTITAAQIAADTITANEIAANAITTSELSANSVTAAAIAANTITAAQIAANTITAAQIAANTITAAQIAANTITTAQLTATAIDGMTITGAILQTASGLGSGGQGVLIKNDVSAGVVQFYAGSTGETPGYINPTLVSGQPQIQISPSTYASWPIPPVVYLRSGNSSGSIKPNWELKPNNSLFIVGGGSFLVTGTSGRVDCGDVYSTGLVSSFGAVDVGTNLILAGNINSAGSFDCNFTNGSLRLASGSNISAKVGTAFASATGVSLNFDTNRVVIGVQSYNATAPTASNTQPLHALDIHSWANGVTMEDLAGGGATGANIGNGGRIVRTSSEAMKTALKPMTKAEAHSVLGLESYTGRFRKDSIESPDDPRRYPFFVAEQAAKAGAELWVGRQHKVTYDKKGKRKITRDKNGKIIYFRTGEVTVAHNALIKELFDRVQTLESKIAELVG